MDLVLDVLLLITSGVNIFVQTFCFPILFAIHRDGLTDQMGHVYILSLSLAEIGCSVLTCAEKVFTFAGLTEVRKKQTHTHMHPYTHTHTNLIRNLVTTQKIFFKFP